MNGQGSDWREGEQAGYNIVGVCEGHIYILLNLGESFNIAH